MNDQTDIPSVSMANTKKELLEAYAEAKKKVDHLGKDLLNAEKARKRMEEKLATATADTQAAQDPVRRLNDLRVAIGHELADLADRFENEIETYRKVQAAIEAKKAELESIFKVETAASDLAALIDAQRVKKENFEQEMAELRNRWKLEQADHERKVKEHKEALQTQRQREKEEFDYAFAREKEQRKNALEDKLNDLEKEIATKRSLFEEDVRQRTADLDAREEAVANQETKLSDLQKEVEAFPQTREKAVQEAVQEATKHLTREFESEKALMQARFDGEKNVLTGKIQALESVVTTQSAQIGDLSQKSEKAYEKVQDIANRAVTAARRDTYMPPGQPAPAAVREEKKE